MPLFQFHLYVTYSLIIIVFSWSCNVWRDKRIKDTALGYETLGGRTMQGLVTPLELVVVPYLRPVWASQREARRRRAARPAKASRERVAVAGSGTIGEEVEKVTSVTVNAVVLH